MKSNLVVLAVDDDMINLKLLKSMLGKTEYNCEILEASNGAEAIDILKSRDDIDIVLLDIIMPIMNGIEVLEICRADSTLGQIPIIVLTTDETKKSEALNAGANSFIMKPIRKDELQSKMESILV